MSVAEPTAADEIASSQPVAPAPYVKRRPFRKQAMHTIRRAHLYFGLFLLPWVVMYGATGFLFNHPTAFSDSPVASFGASEIADTPMESVPKPDAIAAQVVQSLNERANGEYTYSLVEPEQAKYTREFAFATVKADNSEVSILFDVTKPAGTVRSRTAMAAPPKIEEKAPFAITGAKGVGGGGKGGTKGGGTKGGGGRGGGGGGERGGRPEGKGEAGPVAAGLQLDAPLQERVKAAVPVVLERTGFPTGEVTVTSVPDVSFRMSDGAKVWTVTYNALTGAVGGVTGESAPPSEQLSTRRFLTRLHMVHGYPSSQSAKWFWAVIVDAMAFIMVFWGVSGVLMWWQIKATRKLGFVILLVSISAATVLGLGMHDVLSQSR